MQDIKRAIDRIIKIVPALEGQLIPIKEKAKRYPRNKPAYWKQLLGILNNDTECTKNEDIRKILVSGYKQKEHKYSFLAMTPNEYVIATLPDHLSDRLKKYDKISIQVGKSKYEANATQNKELLAKTLRRESILQLRIMKLWIEIRDFLKLWSEQSPKFNIRTKDGFLVVTGFNREGRPPINPLDFLKMLGFEPPPESE